MGLIKATCPGCGANIDYDTEREFCFCTYCGAKVIQDKVIVEHRGKVNVEGVATAESLTERAMIMLSQGDYVGAGKNADRALDMNPKYYPAYLVKLMSRVKAKDEIQLAYAEQPLDSYGEYGLALRFASESEKAKLENYNAESKRNIQKKQKDAENARLLRIRYEPIFKLGQKINELNKENEKAKETAKKKRVSAPIFTVLTVISAVFSVLMLVGTFASAFILIIPFILSAVVTLLMFCGCSDYYEAKRALTKNTAEILRLNKEKNKLEAEYERYKQELEA